MRKAPPRRARRRELRAATHRTRRHRRRHLARRGRDRLRSAFSARGHARRIPCELRRRRRIRAQRLDRQHRFPEEPAGAAHRARLAPGAHRGRRVRRAGAVHRTVEGYEQGEARRARRVRAVRLDLAARGGRTVEGDRRPRHRPSQIRAVGPTPLDQRSDRGASASVSHRHRSGRKASTSSAEAHVERIAPERLSRSSAPPRLQASTATTWRPRSAGSSRSPRPR